MKRLKGERLSTPGEDNIAFTYPERDWEGVYWRVKKGKLHQTGQGMSRHISLNSSNDSISSSSLFRLLPFSRLPSISSPVTHTSELSIRISHNSHSIHLMMISQIPCPIKPFQYNLIINNLSVRPRNLLPTSRSSALNQINITINPLTRQPPRPYYT